MNHYKVWYINTDGKETIEGDFPTRQEAEAYASELQDSGKVHEDCMMAEGARTFNDLSEGD